MALDRNECPLPAGYESSAELGAALNKIRSNDRPLFILGKAGTGKSTLLRYICRLKEFASHVLVAPTGRAALNISGQTIHSLFRLPPRVLDQLALDNCKPNVALRGVKYVFVDEISMVRADVLDAIDYRLRVARKSDAPFGGAKIVMVGDFFQLPPVASGDVSDMLERMGYDSPFAFDAKVLKKNDADYFFLNTVHRQSDTQFVALLNSLRKREGVLDAINTLNDMCHGEHRRQGECLVLTTTNSRASSINEFRLSKIRGDAHSYIGRATGDLRNGKDKLPTPECLSLKCGARVIMLKNDPDGRWVNGSLGTVSKLLEESVLVLLDENRRQAEVSRATWESINYVWDAEKQHPIAQVVGTYSQIPLNLAWALTIHKAQGLSLCDVRVDLGYGAFASGQTYVALSRVTSLEGLSLHSRLQEKDVILDRRIEDFYTRSESLVVSANLRSAIRKLMSIRKRAEAANDQLTIRKIEQVLAAKGVILEDGPQGAVWRRA